MRKLLPWLVVLSFCLLPCSGIASASVEAMLLQADAVRSSDPQKFQQLLRELSSHKAEASRATQEKISYLEAYSQAYVGRYDLAIPDLKRLADTAADIQTRFRAGALLVNGYAVTRRFVEGLRQLEQTTALLQQIDDQELRRHGLGVAAVMYNEIGEYKLGLHFADQMLSIAPQGRAHCFAGQYRVEAQWNLRQLPIDDAPVIDLIKQCAGAQEMVVANTVRNTLARKWAAQGQRDKAIAQLQRYMPEVESTRYARLIGESHSLLAELLFAKGDLAGAESNARQSIAHGTAMPHSQPLVVAYKTLYDIAERKGDTAAALDYYRHYAEADKAYLNDVKARELAYQLVRQETAQKNQQIELLNRQNQVLQLQQRVDRQAAQNTRLLVLLLVLMLAALSYWVYWIRRRQQSLRLIAETDALTGISNRHYFTLGAQRTLADCEKAGEPVALVMFDLDHFKQVNDNYGHATGDWVLREVADTCRGLCRRIDRLGRLGGEEFAILLHGCDLAAATRLAEDCRVRIGCINSRPSGHTFLISASFGVSATSLSGYDLATLNAHADRMLYRAKREGRNRVRAFTPDVPVSVSETTTADSDVGPRGDGRGPLPRSVDAAS